MAKLSQSLKDHLDAYGPVFEGKTCYDYMRKKQNNEFPSSNTTIGWRETWRWSLSNQAFDDAEYNNIRQSSLLNALGSGCNEKTVSKCEALSPQNQ